LLAAVPDAVSTPVPVMMISELAARKITKVPGFIVNVKPFTVTSPLTYTVPLHVMFAVRAPLYGEAKVPEPFIPNIEKGMQKTKSKENMIFFIPPGFIFN
jgi:hypothetical protein